MYTVNHMRNKTNHIIIAGFKLSGTNNSQASSQPEAIATVILQFFQIKKLMIMLLYIIVQCVYVFIIKQHTS